MDMKNAQETGIWIGFGVFGLVCVLLYALFKWLSHAIDEESAYYILFIPSFFAGLIIFRVRTLYVRFVAYLYCKSHGHDLEIFESKDGIKIATCRRCSSHLAGSKEEVH